ncbi:hypothetical protein [Streptomyces sp. MBT62]|uniref:hypothetical protein n=1 Tax=Streptomyces sp. MBT62 TaxID=2800410 RepID=UPI00190CFC9B|nr:hypothetical protein [Streptomyces sp. MBT62]MBK3569415.1 hypothetical protein [Streptomyces sp. MBT62]
MAQRPLDEGVCHQYPSVSAERDRQDEVRQTDQIAVLLDEDGLGLPDPRPDTPGMGAERTKFHGTERFPVRERTGRGAVASNE